MLLEQAPVALIGFGDSALVVHPSFPVKTVQDLIDLAKKRPGEIFYASSGVGGFPHMNTELFKLMTGVKLVHVPFKGGSLSTAAVVSGEVDFSFANMTDALPQIQAGTVRGLAVTSLKRSSYLPDLPSVHEAVLPEFTVETWNAIMAPAKTPEPVIRKMSEVLIRMADDPDVKETMRRAGANTVKTTPDQFRAQIEHEIAQWKPLINEIAEKDKK